MIKIFVVLAMVRKAIRFAPMCEISRALIPWFNPWDWSRIFLDDLSQMFPFLICYSELIMSDNQSVTCGKLVLVKYTRTLVKGTFDLVCRRHMIQVDW